MNTLPAFDALGLPAPPWLLFGLKVFGFWVHLVFMNLWLVGLPVGLLLARKAGPHAESGGRLLRAMPIFIAFGINAGIVPLLFLQVLYPQFFYTTTILQAWAWFAILGFVLIAYYAVYTYVLGTRAGMRGWAVRASGMVASVLFIASGLIFVTEMQLLTRPGGWTALAASSVGGAVKGSGLAISQDALLRFSMMIGLALGTTAGYLALDANFFRHADRPVAARAIRTIVLVLTVLGGAVFMLGGLIYTRRIPDLQQLGVSGTAAALTPVIVLVAGLLYFARPGRAAALLLIALQLVSLLANAIARQLVQFREIAVSFDLHTVPVKFQLSPVVLFLVTLVAGLGVIGWLLRTYVRAAAPVAMPAGEPVAAGGQ